MNIIELAKQAGLKRHQEQAPGIDGVVGNWEDLERFAELVEAAARADEREECAELCDGLADTHEKLSQWSSYKTADTLAQAIRKRGTT